MATWGHSLINYDHLDTSDDLPELLDAIQDLGRLMELLLIGIRHSDPADDSEALLFLDPLAAPGRGASGRHAGARATSGSGRRAAVRTAARRARGGRVMATARDPIQLSRLDIEIFVTWLEERHPE